MSLDKVASRTSFANTVDLSALPSLGGYLARQCICSGQSYCRQCCLTREVRERSRPDRRVLFPGCGLPVFFVARCGAAALSAVGPVGLSLVATVSPIQSLLETR
jgi:hypothetical protein